MILTKQQIEEFETASKPLIKWLNDNCHPHVTAIVTPSSTEILESSAYVLNDEFFKD